jgi:hypothetical protein
MFLSRCEKKFPTNVFRLVPPLAQMTCQKLAKEIFFDDSKMKLNEQIKKFDMARFFYYQSF